MSQWNGCNCSICEKPFEKDDDIVVCPYCGTPYHRACYEEIGDCLFASKHASGYTFEKPRSSAQTIECQTCHTENLKTALFCEKCGNPLAQKVWNGAPAKTEEERMLPPDQKEKIDSIFSSAPNMPNLPPKIDDISTIEWGAYIGKSAPYYLFQFYRMDLSRRKTSFCWSAFLFAPMYFLYRKMWMWAILSGIALTVVSIPSTLQVLMDIGLSIPMSLSAQGLDNLVMVCFFLNWLICVVSGLYAFTLYRQHAVKQIKQLKEKLSTSGTYHQTLSKKGGVSRLAIVLMVALIVGASSALSYWIGPETLAAYYYL